jgi:hypothetical protein
MKVGDLVKVNDDIFRAGMPAHRIGLIVEKATGMCVKSLGTSSQKDIVQILFLGQTSLLKFHTFFLKVISESR